MSTGFSFYEKDHGRQTSILPYKGGIYGLAATTVTVTSTVTVTINRENREILKKWVFVSTFCLTLTSYIFVNFINLCLKLEIFFTG